MSSADASNRVRLGVCCCPNIVRHATVADMQQACMWVLHSNHKSAASGASIAARLCDCESRSTMLCVAQADGAKATADGAGPHGCARNKIYSLF